MADESESIAPHAVLFAGVRERLTRVPFEPFRIVTTSGRAYVVPTADHGGVLPKLRLVHVAHDDGSATEIHSLHLAAIEQIRRRRRSA